MAALITVKRKANDHPSDVIILSSKRLKTEDSPDSVKKKILFFAGTSKKEVNEYEIYKKKVEEVSFKTRYNNTRKNLERIEKQCKADEDTNQGNTFRLVSHKRKSVEESDEDIKIYEAINLDESNLAPKRSKLENDENAITCNGMVLKEIPAESEECETAYVYDVYYHEGGDFDDMMMNDVFSLYPVDHSYLYEPGSDDDVSDKYDEDDDSNDEDNWRNDYPDSDGPFNDYVNDDDGDNDEDFGMSRLRFDDSDEDTALNSSSQRIESEGVSVYERYKRRVQGELQIQ